MNGLEIAVVGMSGVFPGCNNTTELWDAVIKNKNLISKLESRDKVSDFIDYINAKGKVDRTAFNNRIVNLKEEELEIMDPQLLALISTTYDALRDAEYNFNQDNNQVGVYVSASSSYKWRQQVYENKKNIRYEKYKYDYLLEEQYYASQISYRLNLKGSSFVILSGCSSSLVAIHQACRSLLAGDCTMAVAGGVCLLSESDNGEDYNENPMYSKDGVCRVFDSQSNGTVPGEAAGIVILKLLEDAIKDNDDIYAIIKGSAINNDGNRKVSFDSPSIDGQAGAMIEALNMAEICAEDLTFVESHGTGTIFGDAIEVEALKKSLNTEKRQYCALGTIKPNVGYSEAASGVVSFIKAVLSIKNKIYPATINLTNYNSQLNIEETPFFINNENISLNESEKLINALVNSIGAGGTNACVILQEFRNG